MNAGYGNIVFGKGTRLTVGSSKFAATYSKLRKRGAVILKLKVCQFWYFHQTSQNT